MKDLVKAVETLQREAHNKLEENARDALHEDAGAGSPKQAWG